MARCCLHFEQRGSVRIPPFHERLQAVFGLIVIRAAARRERALVATSTPKSRTNLGYTVARTRVGRARPKPPLPPMLLAVMLASPTAESY